MHNATRSASLTRQRRSSPHSLSTAEHVYLRAATILGTHRFELLLLVAITVLAFALRFYKLGEWSFWRDEMFTVSGREDGFNYSFLRQSTSLWLIQQAVGLWGVTEWYARLVPAVIGVITIPVFYWFSRRVFGSAVGLLATALLALSPWHLYWSQNARFYTALLLFYTLALFTFYLGLEEDRPFYMILSLLFLGIASKERLLALFFLPVVTGYLLLLWRLRWPQPAGLRPRNLLVMGTPALIVGVFFTGPYLTHFGDWMAGFGYANNNPAWLLGGTVYYIGLPVFCLGLAGFWYGLGQQRRSILLFGLGALLPLLAIIALSPVHYTANRYVFLSLACWFLLAAFALWQLLSRSSKTTYIIPISILFLLLLQPLSDTVLYFRTQKGNRSDWRSAFAVVQQHRAGDDLVFTTAPDIGAHYLQTDVKHWNQFSIDDVADSQTAWFVEDMVAQELYPATHTWLEENGRLVAVADVHFQARNFLMRVYQYEPGNKLTE